MVRDDVCDYIILKVKEAGSGLSLLKLHKLLYYTQAWFLAFHGRPLFDGKFQAWVHGPVNRELYDRFKETKSLYSEIRTSNMREGFDPDSLPPDERAHVDNVLGVYARYSGTQLEGTTHREVPWVKAREGYRSSQRCEIEIDEGLMARYYAGLVSGSGDGN
jgi:uncharacterized phage-associated protein